jgi:GT2 family glycosyltransferase
MTAAPRVSVLVVNFNGERLLAGCLDAIRQWVDVPHEVIVVDNGSDDGSVALIEAKYPEARLVRSERNLGFTGGNNLAAAHATAPLLLLLNADARLASALTAALELASRDEVGAVGCRLTYPGGRLQASIGYEHTPVRLVASWLGLDRVRRAPALCHRTVTDPAHYDVEHRDVAWVSGACLITRAEVWRRLGGLDERYFMYVEDVDYCRRVRDLGLRVAYTPDTTVEHLEAGGRSWVGRRALLSTSRSYAIFTRKFYGGAAEILVRAALGLVFVLRAAAYQASTLATASPDVRDKAASYFAAGRALLFRPSVRALWQ